MNFKVDSFVFCDDIRQEASGKHILIGVYPADLVPASIPSQFPISIWLRLSGLPKGTHQMQAVLRSPGGAMASLGGNLHVADASHPVVLLFAGMFVDIRAFGNLVLELGFGGKKPKPIARLSVSPLSASQEQPVPGPIISSMEMSGPE